MLDGTKGSGFLAAPRHRPELSCFCRCAFYVQSVQFYRCQQSGPPLIGRNNAMRFSRPSGGKSWGESSQQSKSSAKSRRASFRSKMRTGQPETGFAQGVPGIQQCFCGEGPALESNGGLGRERSAFAWRCAPCPTTRRQCPASLRLRQPPPSPAAGMRCGPRGMSLPPKPG